jgi:hypothetical protein
VVLAPHGSGSLVDDLGRVGRKACRAVPPSVDSRLTLSSYLILPGLYAKDPQLKFSPAVLSVIVVALLTAGYSFTALVCFACRNDLFQAERVFLYDFLASCHAKH